MKIAKIKREKKIDTKDVMQKTLYIALYAMINKCGATHTEIRQIAEGVNEITDSFIRGDIKWEDIRHTIEEEYGIQ